MSEVLKTPNDWYDMDVGDFRTIEGSHGSYKEVMRVPNGWIVFSGDYAPDEGIAHASCFVPDNKHLQGGKEV